MRDVSPALRHGVRGAALLGAALTLSSGALATRKTADPGVDTVLSDARYRFCHEADYPLSEDEHAWCPILIESSEVCPTLVQACQLPPAKGQITPSSPRRLEPKKDAEPTPAEKPNQPLSDGAPPKDEHASVTVAPVLSGVSLLLFIGIAVVFLVLVGRALAKSFFSRDADAAPPEAAAPEALSAAVAAAPRGPVETDVDRLLARARAAAARGEYARAIDDVYAALLRRLDADGRIDIHPSRTNGDYVRQLRDDASLRIPVREVVKEVERVHFGATAPSERAYRAVLDRVVPIVSRVAAIALFCFGLSAVISCSPVAATAARSDHAGNTPTGTQAVIDLLTAHKFEVKRRSETLDKLVEPKTLVLLSGASLDGPTWVHLLSWVDDGGRLVLAGVASLPPELGLRLALGTTRTTEIDIDEDSTFRGVEKIRVPPGAEIHRADGEARDVPHPLLLRGEAIYATSFDRGAGHIVVVADDRLFCNASLAVADNGAFLVGLFESMPSPRQIEIVDAWTGVGAETPFAAVEHANLLPVILQLFALLALLYLWKGIPFARLRDPPAETRRAFADHARALGLAYGRARASRHVLGLYASWALDRLRERVQRSGRQGLLPLAEAIATRTGRPEGEVMRVLVDASGAREESGPSSRDYGRFLQKSSGKRAPRVDESASEFALMRELEGFLTATGRRRPARRSSKENPHA
ncbi:MAG: DUF4350 domain-containing protein [Byssovorax sp.]